MYICLSMNQQLIYYSLKNITQDDSNNSSFLMIYRSVQLHISKKLKYMHVPLKHY